MKVLAVDDHPADLKLISHLFAMSGHLAVTAYPDSYPPSTVLSAGGNACIVKPVDTRQLSSQIERIVLGQAVP
jgi:hypothetical protein